MHSLKYCRHVEDMLCLGFDGEVLVREVVRLDPPHHLQHREEFLHDGDVEESEVSRCSSLNVNYYHQTFDCHLLFTLLDEEKIYIFLLLLPAQQWP